MKPSNHADTISGQCFCGTVQFSIELPIFAVIYCHCNMCRNSYGADYSTWVRVMSANFNITQGSDQVSKYVMGEQTTRYFCQQCASTVYTTDSEFTDSIGILRGMIRDELGQDPSKHFFYDHRATWVDMNDGLDKMGGVSGFEAL